RRDARATAFTQTVGPQELAGFSVERDHGSTRAGGRVQDAVDGERRAFELVLRARTEHIGLEPPGDFEVLEGRRVCLSERRVFRALYVGRVMRPVALRERWLTAGGAAILSRKSDGDPCADHEHEHTCELEPARHRLLPWALL